MKQNRRDMLKGAGAMAALAATKGFASDKSKKSPRRTAARGVAKGLTLLTIRRDGELRLAVKTEKGILDVPQAAKLLNMHAPATLDDLLQQEDGPSVNVLVDAATKAKNAQAALLKEEESNTDRW